MTYAVNAEQIYNMQQAINNNELKDFFEKKKTKLKKRMLQHQPRQHAAAQLRRMNFAKNNT